MTDTWLTPDEVVELTARQRYSAQCRMLARMGIPFLPNAIGRPLIERRVVLKGGVTAPALKKTEPNWDAIPKRRSRVGGRID
ncbi:MULTISPECIES: DUF4224 domain-containing protein [Luteimonas]|uniref:DUF4224 domain-containing protein n=1 Tax=Luteimonas TaxID=83614 RepID=UPI000C7CE935|nr:MULTISPECIES: DUF4224 domain-containing protein [Luteimonas]